MICKDDVQLGLSTIMAGSKDDCFKSCLENDLCKSFDFCSGNLGDTFCHLKDKDTADYQKKYTLN